MGVDITTGLLGGSGIFAGTAVVSAFLISFYVRARTKDLS